MPFFPAISIGGQAHHWPDPKWLFLCCRALAFTFRPICQVTTSYGSFLWLVSIIWYDEAKFSGRGDPSFLHSPGDTLCNAMSSSGLPSTRERWMYRNKSSQQPWEQWKAWSTWNTSRGSWESWESLAWRTEGSGGSHQFTSHKYLVAGIPKTKPGSPRWYPGEGLDPMGMKWKTRNSVNIQEKALYFWE